MADVCPYFDTTYKTCNFFGTTQDGYQRESVCMSRDNWKRCPNYEKRDYSEKVNKRLRPNPDL